MQTISYEVGRLLCSQVRNYLHKVKFEGAKIDWIESTGFLEREFTIKGEPDDLQAIRRDLSAWVQIMRN